METTCIQLNQVEEETLKFNDQRVITIEQKGLHLQTETAVVPRDHYIF